MHNPAPEIENQNELTPVANRVDNIESEEIESGEHDYAILIEETDCSEEWLVESIEDEVEKPGPLPTAPQKPKRVRSKVRPKEKSPAVECAECGKRIATKRGLLDHIKIIHRRDPDERIICPKCGVFFRTSTNLNSHMQWRHGNVKNYQCDVCAKFFKTSHALRRHKIVSFFK